MTGDNEVEWVKAQIEELEGDVFEKDHWSRDDTTECHTCKGDGELQKVVNGLPDILNCPDCKGTGRVPAEPKPQEDYKRYCQVCNSILGNDGVCSQTPSHDTTKPQEGK